MFDQTDWASHLAGCNILVAVSNGGLLNLLDDAGFAQTISAVKHSWLISTVAKDRVVLLILRVAEDTST